MRALVIALLLLSRASFASDDHLVGWSTDASFYAVFGTTCAQNVIQLCPSSKSIKPTWPAQYGTSDDGSCIDSDSVESMQSLDEDALAKLAPVKGAAGPAGVKVSVGKTGTVTIARGAQKLTFTIDNAQGASLADVVWRPDGKAVAVQVLTKAHGACRADQDHAVGVFEVAALGTPTDRTAAKAKNVEGMAALRKKDYARAAAAFKAAIAADPTFLVAHYNLASVSSIAGDVPTARSELQTISDAGTPEAKKMLAQARSDADLDFASTDPKVRTLIGAGPYPTEATKRLTERKATWSSEGPCEGQIDATIALTFGKAGKLQVAAWCKGQKGVTNTEKWTPKQLTLEEAPLLGDGDLMVTWTRCPGSDVDGSCFQVGDRVFHRGVPHSL